MSKANQKQSNSSVINKRVKLRDNRPGNNQKLNPVNRRGIPGNKQQPGQSRQDYDKECRSNTK